MKAQKCVTAEFTQLPHILKMELLLLDFSPQLRLAHEPVDRSVRANANSSCTTIVSRSKLADTENPVVFFLYYRIL